MTTEPAPCDLLVCGEFVLPMTDGLPVIERGAVAVTGGKVAAVGPADLLRSRFRAAETLEGGIVLPGLVNTHGHAAMTLYRGLMDDVPLHEWLTRYVWPAEKRFTTPENVALGTRLAIAEMIASGTTSFADMYFFEDAVGAECEAAGMRVLLGQAVIAFATPDSPNAGASMERARQLVARYREHPLISVSLALHAVYTVPEEAQRRGVALADELGIPIQIHLSESVREVEDCVRETGLTPPHLLARSGVLRPGTVCAHGVHLSPDEMALLRDRGAGVSMNPESNLKLGSGIPDVAALLASGMPLGLGTDGAASNNDLDLWDAVRLTALLPKGIARDPTLAPAREAVRLATRGGAELVSMGGTCGSLTPGRQADLCVVDLRAPHLTPVYDPYAHLAYAVRGSDVRHTVIAGRVVYRERRHTTIDVEETLSRVRRIAPEIAAAVIRRTD